MVISLKNKKTFNTSNLTLFFLIVFILLILRYPQQTCSLALQGLEIWAIKMIPILFPFMMISSIMIYSGLDNLLAKILYPFLHPLFRCSFSGIYAIFMGFFCGFPMGAKVVAELYLSQKITKQEANQLLAFCNLIGPTYFLGLVIPILQALHMHTTFLFLFGMYGIPALYGILLFSCHAACQTIFPNSTETNISWADIIRKSCLQNVQSLLLLGGYITFTNALCIVLLVLPISDVGVAIGNSLIEINGGILLLYTTETLSAKWKCFWIMTTLTFGGLSCMLQAANFIHQAGLSLKKYLLHKIFVTCFSAIYYFVLIFYT